MDLETDQILLTGFEPFAEFMINSSWQAARLVTAKGKQNLISECLPVDHHASREKLFYLLQSYRPKICLCTGLAVGEHFRLELMARKPEQFADLNGANLYRGQWPWEKVRQAFQEEKLPIKFSEDAGQYVCESTYWSLLDFQDRHNFPTRTAFLHVPPLSEKWTTEKMAKGMQVMLESLTKYITDDAAG